MEGDVIYKVDGVEMAGLTLEEVVSHIKGEEGTKVTITLLRSGSEIEVEITRARVSAPTVDSEMFEDGIGYLQITEFDDVTVSQFKENMASLREQDLEGMIIDLRGNPGGSVTSVCAIAEQFLPEGLIFYMEDKDGNKTEYKCEGADFDLPMVALVNEYSASAAEILSGAVKDAGIGKLVGKKTFGKGIVQTVAPLDDGSAIKLTIANATNDKIYIKVTDLVDVYTAQQNAAQVQVTIDQNKVVSAAIVAGSIGATELAADAVETAKIKDKNVTKAKLADAVQTSLGLADTAVQPGDFEPATTAEIEALFA
jgi:hypothetical protein